ncbi:MAG TPA: amidophosphoribosyltransferase, partial [Brevibacterium sp.]|nr:amidophosphoribosyltransferase [Brevibacterium sp.]
MFGVFAPGEDVSRLIYFGLHALQHRGQESAGIAVGDGESVTVKKDVGLVTQVFNESDLATLTGFVGVGHTRLATGDAGDLWEAAQPHLGWIGDETIALAHNGALINGRQIRKKLMNLDIGLRSTTDSEAAAKLIGHYTQQTHVLREGITRAMEDFQGAYSMMLITPKALYAFRDPSGIRPLSLGELPDGAGYVIASETCAFDIVGATFVRDIEPGEIVKVGPEGVVNRQGLPPAERPALCIFEHVYLARPDSIMDGAAIYDARAEMGRRLA